MSASEVEQVAALFDRFAAGFVTFDAANLVDLFATPGVALRRDGGIVALTARDDVLRYYQSALDRYRQDGCTSSRWSGMVVTPMGRGGMLAAVTWELLRADRSVAACWRQSYCLSLMRDGPRIFASAQHVE